MSMYIWKTRIATMMLVLGSATVARAQSLEPTDPIPVVLVDDTDVSETPDPVCGVCSIVIKPTSSSSSTTTTTTITIPSEDAFHGDVQLVVWLEGDVRKVVWIPAVTIGAADEVVVTLQSGSDWTWDEVQYAWTRMVPTA
ncbi:hypothetical protein [Paraliomyxa miuraensis]|uniref:hypothetical protein n=1 Tax=Paraliomyxa miuraensis TaxID=376150 RepID=UPI002259DE68|nr:hypothetical protein [Paraliomyxa miuraensis]MCX4246898.1 hypothetical protein [Paraliomyxa miuraensis]